MKAVTGDFNTQHTGSDSHSPEKHEGSSRKQYFLVVALLTVAYLFTIWITSAPSTPATGQTGMGFAFFWLGGGLITLVLLTIAAKR